MKRDILKGRWWNIQSQNEFDLVLKYGQPTEFWRYVVRVHRGDYIGPGKYLCLDYTERCPRNCCDDDVRELISSKDVIEECKEQMCELASLLKKARE